MEPHVRDDPGHVPVALKSDGGRGARAFRIALLVLPLGVLGNLAYLLLGTDRALLASIDELPRAYLLAALGLGLVPWITGTLRLLVWSRFLGYRLPLLALFRMTLVVDLGSAISPTAIGGEAFRWGMLVRHRVNPGHAATLALMPKVEDAAFFLLALPLAIVWTTAWRLPVVASSVRLLSGNVLTIVAIGLVIATIAWLILRAAARGLVGGRIRRVTVRVWARARRRVRRLTRDAHVAFALIARGGGSRLVLNLGFTAAHWIARYSVISALALFLGVPFDPVLFWLLQWVVFTMMSFIPTPGATGGAEVAFTVVYASLLPAGVIGLATAAWRMFTFYVPVGLAAVIFALSDAEPDF